MKQDPKLISKQAWEPKYVHTKFKVPIDVIKDVLFFSGVSRARLYYVLSRMGYDVPAVKLSKEVKEKCDKIAKGLMRINERDLK